MFFHCVNNLYGFFILYFVVKIYIEPLMSLITTNGKGDKKYTRTIAFGKIN